MPDTESRPDVTSLTVQLLSAYLVNNTVASDDLANLIRTTRSALTEDPAPTPAVAETHVPAVTPRKSLASPEYILSLIDGKPYKTLKRHLARHGMTPDTYRERYNLPATYPMVAPSFAAKRREIAQKIGLGARRAPEIAKVEAASQSRTAAKAVNEAGLANAQGKSKVAKSDNPKTASTARSRTKAVAEKTSIAAIPEVQVDNEEPVAAKRTTDAKKPVASAKKGAKSAGKAEPDAATDGALPSEAPPLPSEGVKVKRGASAGSKKSGRVAKRPTGTRAKMTAAANRQAVTESSENAESAPTQKAQPARRGKLALFRGGTAGPAGNTAVNADALPVTAGGAETATKAPRAKRMARTPASNLPK